MAIQFFVPLKKIPKVTHQDKIISVKNGKPIIFDSPRLKEAKSIFENGLAGFAPKHKDQMLNAPIGVELYWCFSVEKDKQPGDYHIVKPDADNLAKTFIDRMTYMGFWKDDSHVSKVVSEKRYDKISGVFVKAYEL